MTQCAGSIAVYRCPPPSAVCPRSSDSSSPIINANVSTPPARVRNRTHTHTHTLHPWQSGQSFPTYIVGLVRPYHCRHCFGTDGLHQRASPVYPRQAGRPRNQRIAACNRAQEHAWAYRISQIDPYSLVATAQSSETTHLSNGASTGSSFSEGSDQGAVERSHIMSYRPSPRQHISRYRNGASPFCKLELSARAVRLTCSTASSRSHACRAASRQLSSKSVLTTAVVPCGCACGLSATTPWQIKIHVTLVGSLYCIRECTTQCRYNLGFYRSC